MTQCKEASEPEPPVAICLASLQLGVFITYLAGSIVLVAHLSQYGFLPSSPIRIEYLWAGCWAVIGALPAGVGYLSARESILHRKPLTAISRFIFSGVTNYATLVLAIVIFEIRLDLKAFSSPIIWLLSVALVAIVLDFALDAELSTINRACTRLKTRKRQSLVMKFAVLYAEKVSKQICKQIEQKWPQVSLGVVVFIVYCFLFGKSGYPAISRSWGGGEPSPVTITCNSDMASTLQSVGLSVLVDDPGDPTKNKQARVLVIHEDSNTLVVTSEDSNPPTQAVRLQKSIVDLIEYPAQTAPLAHGGEVTPHLPPDKNR